MQEESKDDSVEWRTLGVSSERYKVTETVVDMTRPQVPLREITVPAKPQDVIFDLNKTALIIIDMQNDFCSDQGWLKGVGQDISGVKDILSPLERTSQKLRSLDVPIIWVNLGY